MSGLIITEQLLAGGESQKVAMSIVSAQTAVLTQTSYLVSVDATCFVRTSANPTALSDGTDQVLLAGTVHRIVPILPGNKIAFIMNAGTGTAYLTPNA